MLSKSQFPPEPTTSISSQHTTHVQLSPGGTESGLDRPQLPRPAHLPELLGARAGPPLLDIARPDREGLAARGERLDELLHPARLDKQLRQVRVLVGDDRRQVHALEQVVPRGGRPRELERARVGDDDLREVGLSQLLVVFVLCG